MTQTSPGSEPDTPGNPYTHVDDDQTDERPVDTIPTHGEYL